jgi:purine-binding chemotaxis protein CheW
MSMQMRGDTGGAELDERGNGQYLSFTLGSDDYGVEILKVQEIRGWEPVRPLPDTPDYIKGVLDMRGTIVPIVDLRLRFNLVKASYTPTTVIIVVAVENTSGASQLMGIVVDGVSDVLDVGEDKLRRAPDLGSRISTRFIRGMVSRDNRMVILLDVGRLLDPDELTRLEALD